MSDTALPDRSGCTADEFMTLVVVDRAVEPLYRRLYSDFGWHVEKSTGGRPEAAAVVLHLRRDRRIKNRSIVVELQRRCERTLDDIREMEERSFVVRFRVPLTKKRARKTGRDIAARYDLARETGEQARRLLS
ncbi:hypothetical protein BH93_20045 [Rhodococcoides fascians A25f]|uniref:hypothetical protein n=1 Tax=Rhodococcoides fascians TaxID=1828 RepID=UPI0012D2A68A|nr:hypothetical protein [Rhodococcus fascians]QII07354.1 hypothetical protein BH93_20045 [Rhodococcus fascians A25f]